MPNIARRRTHSARERLLGRSSVKRILGVMRSGEWMPIRSIWRGAGVAYRDTSDALAALLKHGIVEHNGRLASASAWRRSVHLESPMESPSIASAKIVMV